MVQVQAGKRLQAENAAAESRMAFLGVPVVSPARLLAASWGALGCPCGTVSAVLLGLGETLQRPRLCSWAASLAPRQQELEHKTAPASLDSFSFPVI